MDHVSYSVFRLYGTFAKPSDALSSSVASTESCEMKNHERPNLCCNAKSSAPARPRAHQGPGCTQGGGSMDYPLEGAEARQRPSDGPWERSIRPSRSAFVNFTSRWAPWSLASNHSSPYSRMSLAAKIGYWPLMGTLQR